jgi:hypothetical protein
MARLTLGGRSARIGACDVRMSPAITGSLAARAVEPRQVREEAALRRLPRVPRIIWWPSGSCAHPLLDWELA